VAARGEEREVREIARRLLAAAAEGIPFEAMGVLVRRPETYRGAIRDVFGAAGIPYTWGVAPRLGETRAGRSLRLLVTARGEDFARAAVMDFLAAAELRRAPDGEGVQPREWDRLSREAGIVAGRLDWRRGLARLARRAEAAAAAEMPAEEGQTVRAGPPAAAVTAFGIVVGRLLDATATIPDAAPAADLAARFLRAFRPPCRATQGTDQGARHLPAPT